MMCGTQMFWGAQAASLHRPAACRADVLIIEKFADKCR
jgi:hypothetical protein